MKKLQLTFLIAAALCVLSILASSLAIGAMASKLNSQTAAERWSGDGSSVAQLSAFISPEAGVARSDIERGFTKSVEQELVNASISAADDDARLFAYSYSSEGSATLSRLNEYGRTVKSGVSARVVACGADFFIFHPLKMLSGHYFSTTDILNDFVVIDNDLAWQFFGSSDVVGRTLKINGRDCYISGVCESGRDGEYSEFYGDTPRIYVSYSFAGEILGELPVTTVETVMTAPVGGFAMQIFESALGADKNYTEYIENSARFDDDSLRALLGDYNSRGVRTKPVAYPYWENAAVKLTDAAALVYLFKLVPIVLLALILAAEVVIIYTKRRAIVGAVRDRISTALRNRRQNKRAKARKKGEVSA